MNLCRHQNNNQNFHFRLRLEDDLKKSFEYIGRSEENVMDNSNIETEDMADLESSWDLESVAREKVGLGGPDVSDIVGEAIDPSLCHQPPSGGFNIVWSVISSIFGMTTHLKETHASKPERENNGEIRDKLRIKKEEKFKYKKKNEINGTLTEKSGKGRAFLK